MIAKSLAEAEPGEVGLYMQGRTKALLFCGRQAENNVGLTVIIGKGVGPDGSDYRSFVINEANFNNFSEVLFFPLARIKPDFDSLSHSYEYAALDLFQVGGDDYLVLPLEGRGFWDHAFLNLSSNELLFQLPYARGRWYFKSWSLVVPDGDNNEMISLYDWPAPAG